MCKHAICVHDNRGAVTVTGILELLNQQRTQLEIEIAWNSRAEGGASQLPLPPDPRWSLARRVRMVVR